MALKYISLWYFLNVHVSNHVLNKEFTLIVWVCVKGHCVKLVLSVHPYVGSEY